VTTKPTALALSATPLWELAAEYAEAVEAMVEAGGDMSEEELVARLDAIQMAFPLKVENCAIVYRALETSAQADKAFAAPWVERAARKASAAERIRAYVQRCMEQAGQERVESERGGARLQNNSQPSVTFEGDAKTLPVPLQKVTVELDKRAAAALAAAGGSLPEGVKVERGKHLRWL